MGGAIRELLRSDILAARWQPGAKLQVGQLSELYATSTTVVREALTRLAGERLVQVRPNRGFFVAEYSLDELRDINELRCRVEEYGISLAIERGDLGWESALMASHHTLERTPRRRSDDPHHVNDAWFVAHRAFHAKLLEPCGLEVLTDLAAMLADSTLLYRQMVAPTSKAESRNIEGEHKAILDAVLARDSELAGRLLREHYTRTLEVIAAAEIHAVEAEPAATDGDVPSTRSPRAARSGS